MKIYSDYVYNKTLVSGPNGTKNVLLPKNIKGFFGLN